MKQPDLEIDLLRTFATVAETGNFTTAGDILGRTQSAVSQQVRRLEEIVGKQLFVRTSRTVGLTPDGETLLAHAHGIIAMNDEAIRRIKAPPISGRLRLGVSEDFIPYQLPLLLSWFRKAHPGVHLELMTGLSTFLVAYLGEGKLDLAIAKRDAQPQAGRVIWREPLAWIAPESNVMDEGGTLSLVTLPEPCSYRRVMFDVLRGKGRQWRITCTAHSIMGLQAAVAGGLGISVLGKSFINQGLMEVSPDFGLPALPDTEIAVFGEEGAGIELSGCLVDFITTALKSMHRGDVNTRGAGQRA